ncbi:urea ABC transporter permease subunit UrtB [Marinivivus vitaminiproducens]|uniref:urea ABC transporter permease subunit UrtB n=1 Tax=Marinivivus vitaminiproducens TaxID=3035935 RepID=UPI0027A806FA|nr:urea ABC transporter permease subunit UrtB [Geminicoccaceae bacterium SCSIO 64248]
MVLFRLIAIALALAGLHAGAARADAFDEALTGVRGGYAQVTRGAEALAATGDPRAVDVLNALSEGRLYTAPDDGPIGIGTEQGGDIRLVDPRDGSELGVFGSRDVERIRVNNRVRGAVTAAMGRLQLSSPDPGQRRAAVDGIVREPSPEAAEQLRAAIEREQDTGVRGAMTFALAQIELQTGDREQKLAAIETMKASTDPQARAALGAVSAATAEGAPGADAELHEAAEDAIASVDRTREWLNLLLNIYQGISLGSILLLAALGLAITFGVMGVINMAHGEMIMLGAYTAFVVQQVFRAYAPGAMELYLLAAVPAAFLVSGAAGIAIEQSVIRFLYKRPLETLLATWGISLMLQQAVRLIFGATNQQVANPSWMSGGIEILGGVFLTYNRLIIIVFCLIVLAVIALVLRFSTFGLQMRAVVQNRDMARTMGINTARVDALTFGLGSGVAGMAGAALSQIGNVSPNLGTQYIVDSFLVVVFGGVGQLAGTLTGAMGLGIVNKLLEPYAGAVLGKVLVLVGIILFIQFRPRGLFVLKGRAAEA